MKDIAKRQEKKDTGQEGQRIPTHESTENYRQPRRFTDKTALLKHIADITQNDHALDKVREGTSLTRFQYLKNMQNQLAELNRAPTSEPPTISKRKSEGIEVSNSSNKRSKHDSKYNNNIQAHRQELPTELHTGSSMMHDQLQISDSSRLQQLGQAVTADLTSMAEQPLDDDDRLLRRWRDDRNQEYDGYHQKIADLLTDFSNLKQNANNGQSKWLSERTDQLQQLKSSLVLNKKNFDEDWNQLDQDYHEDINGAIQDSINQHTNEVLRSSNLGESIANITRQEILPRFHDTEDYYAKLYEETLQGYGDQLLETQKKISKIDKAKKQFQEKGSMPSDAELSSDSEPEEEES